jgi:MFS family permease
LVQRDDPPATAYAWYTLALLALANALSFLDRTIITMLVGPIRETMQISDTQFSLMHGLAFALFYTLLGIPIAWLSDRYDRSRIISIGIFFWSLMTVGCGLARNFLQLFLMRVGVGFGEASLSPAAYSLMTEIFPRRTLGRAVGLYGAGIYLGTGLSFIVGGVLIDALMARGPISLPVLGALLPWQQTMVLVGICGIPLALLVLTLLEPRRRASNSISINGAAETARSGLFSYLWAHSGFLLLLLGGAALISMLFNGYLAWSVEYFVREHGWSKTEIGYYFGTAVLIMGSLGVISGGLISDLLARQNYRNPPMMTALLLTGLLLPWPWLATTGGPTRALIGLSAIIFLASASFTPLIVSLQMRTQAGLRARVSAVYMLVVNLAGVGMGGAAVASVSDYVLSGSRLGMAMSLVGGFGSLLGVAFLLLCLRHDGMSARPVAT